MNSDTVWLLYFYDGNYSHVRLAIVENGMNKDYDDIIQELKARVGEFDGDEEGVTLDFAVEVHMHQVDTNQVPGFAFYTGAENVMEAIPNHRVAELPMLEDEVD